MEILTIILAILKGIGIILLSLLALILLLLLVICFCPIRYQAEGAYNNAVYVRAKVSWFLGLLKVQVSYDESLKWSVNVLGFQILPKKESDKDSKKKTSVKNKKKKKKENADQSASPETVSEAKTEAISESISESAAESGAESTSESALESAASAAQTTTTDGEDTQSSIENAFSESQSDKDEQTSEFEKFLTKISSLPEKIESKIQSICDKIKEIKANADHYLKILKREEVQRLLKKVIRMLGKMLMHIRPRKFQVIAHVGMDDPATTGKIMSIQGLLYPWIAERIVIFPYFEEKKLEANFYIAGHTILGVLLFLVLRVVIHKDVLTLIRLLRKKEDNANGRA